MRIPDNVWQILCEVESDAAAGELVYAILLQLGIDPQDIVERTQGDLTETSVFVSTRGKATKLIADIQNLNLKDLNVSIKELRKNDWQDQWKKGIKPFALTKTIDVIPRWVEPRLRPTRKFPIYIDTNLAFGTGLHETTRFMSQIIEICRGKFDSFLDIGTGSGILVIVARYCGAKDITAIDIDPQSVKVAKENLAANNVVGVKVFTKDFARSTERKTYDFVAANLVTHDLMGFGKSFARRVKEGRFLAVSGISLKNLPALKKSFAKLSLREVKTLKGKEWAAVLYQKI